MDMLTRFLHYDRDTTIKLLHFCETLLTHYSISSSTSGKARCVGS